MGATIITLPRSIESMSNERSDRNKGRKPAGKHKMLIKFPEEEEEDILRESDSRFVLFPIKYNEVCMVEYHTR